MKSAAALSLIAALAVAAPALAGDAAAGKQKATACVTCHGDASFPGIFYTLQLAGRDADKLTVKTNKYRTGKILHPIMNVFTMSLTEADIADISAYYKSIGKPALSSPLIRIKGDDEVVSLAAEKVVAAK
jgi:cytochrome c553